MKKTHQTNELAGKTILLVSTGTEKKEFILKRLKDLGLKIIALNSKKNWAEPYIYDWILSDTNNQEESIQAVRKYVITHPQTKIDGVITFWEANVLLTSRIRDAFGFIGISNKTALRLRNKHSFRAFCAEHDLPHPKHFLLKSKDDIKEALKILKFPLVTKPVLGAMSAYVVKVNNKQELIKTYEYIITNIKSYEKAKEWDKLDEVLVEEYIEGDEVDIDILIQNGKIKFYSITDNYATVEPFFVETGQSIPSNLPEKAQQALIDMAEEILERSGVQDGCIHFEAKSTSNGPVPIEVNLRMGGDEVHSFVKGAWGIDLVEYAAKIALGIYIPRIHRGDVPLAYLSGKYFLSDYSGVVVKLSIDEKIKKLPFLEQLHTIKQVGDIVLVPPEGFDFMGWATAKGINPMDADDNLNQIMEGVQYEVTKFDPTSSLGKTQRINSFSHASLNKTLLKGMARIESIKQFSKGRDRKITIGILANLYEGTRDPIEKHLTETAMQVKDALQNLGYPIKLYNINNLSETLQDLQQNGVDLIFNVAKRFNDSSLREPNIAALCESLQLPYTGSSPLALSLGKDKIMTKKIVTYHHIPTPNWDYANSVNDPIDSNLTYPLIVKPSNMYGSVGVSTESVVNSEPELRKQLKKIIEGLGTSALIEEYIEGDEYDISIIGNGDDLKILPLTRSKFSGNTQNDYNIFTYENKWLPHKAKNKIVVERPAKNVPKKLESLLTELSFDIYKIFGCHDYGRVEIKVDSEGNPYILELNTNPSLHKKSFLAQAYQSSNAEYEELIQKIVEVSLRRYSTIKTLI